MTGGRAVLAAVAVALLAACGPTQVQQEFQKPTCQPSGVLGLMAQAVPTSRFLPCIAQFPAGWSFEANDIESSRASFWMNSDRAGFKALEVTLTRTCRPTGEPLPSDTVGTRLFAADGKGKRYVGARYYLFQGGCIVYRFDFPRAQAPFLVTDMTNAVGVFPRAALLEAARKLGLKV